jgi:hypothetical protein
LRRATWPRELLDKCDAAATGQKIELTPEESLLLLRENGLMIQESFVKPQLSPHPGPTEISPEWIVPEDREFVQRYLRGQVTAENVDLDRFPRGEQKPSEGSSEPGADVQGAPV